MKKFILCVMALVCAVTVSAQTAEEMQASADRMAKLAQLQMPKSTGLNQMDALLTKAGEAASASLRISTTLSTWKSDIDKGTIDLNILNEAIELGKNIGRQGEAVSEITQLVPKATEELKSVKNPMKLKAAKNALGYSQNVLEIVGEETPYQAQTVAEIIRQLKKE